MAIKYTYSTVSQTKCSMLFSDEGSRIQLTFTAYAIQSDEIEYADALAEVLELADLNA